MAFIDIITELPPDGVPILCKVFFYPGVIIECTYDSLNQIFTATQSGLFINAQFVLEWELIP
jgi:hypothetical protein